MKNARNVVGWFEIYVQNLERAQSFYEKTFQIKLQPLPSPALEMLAFPGDSEAYGCPGALVKMEGKDSGGGGTLVYFSCADCGVEATRAAQNGGQIVREKFPIGDYGFIALIVDTEGNVIGLHSMK
ncbi:MAG TPA: VOC family protein [Verrucomicrobiae bacterium]|nr:VOC family protein [Verrucomicrobiae bacterium]